MMFMSALDRLFKHSLRIFLDAWTRSISPSLLIGRSVNVAQYVPEYLSLHLIGLVFVHTKHECMWIGNRTRQTFTGARVSRKPFDWDCGCNELWSARCAVRLMQAPTGQRHRSFKAQSQPSLGIKSIVGTFEAEEAKMVPDEDHGDWRVKNYPESLKQSISRGS